MADIRLEHPQQVTGVTTGDPVRSRAPWRRRRGCGAFRCYWWLAWWCWLLRGCFLRSRVKVLFQIHQGWKRGRIYQITIFWINLILIWLFLHLFGSCSAISAKIYSDLEVSEYSTRLNWKIIGGFGSGRSWRIRFGHQSWAAAEGLSVASSVAAKASSLRCH